MDQCVGCRLPKDLHGRDLHGLRFIGSDLRNVDFSRANLRGARFSGADLDGARFDDADLRDARFEGVKLSGVNFDGHGRVGVRRTVHDRRYVWIEDGDIAIPPTPPLPPPSSAARDHDRDAAPFGGKAPQPRVVRVLRTPVGDRVVDEREHRADAAVTALDAPFQAVEGVANAEYAHLHPAEILVRRSEIAHAGLRDRTETRDEKGDGKKRAAHENLQAYYRDC
jgi:Pentapeptide repeats (8 copies)